MRSAIVIGLQGKTTDGPKSGLLLINPTTGSVTQNVALDGGVRQLFAVEGGGDNCGFCPRPPSAFYCLGASRNFIHRVVAGKRQTATVLAATATRLAAVEGLTCFSLTEDGYYLLGGNAAGSTVLWDVISGKMLRIVPGSSDALVAILMLQNGAGIEETIITVTNSGEVRLLSLAETVSARDEQVVKPLAMLRIPDMGESRVVSTFFLSGWAMALDTAPNSLLVVITSDSIVVFDLRQRKEGTSTASEAAREGQRVVETERGALILHRRIARQGETITCARPSPDGISLSIGLSSGRIAGLYLPAAFAPSSGPVEGERGLVMPSDWFCWELEGHRGSVVTVAADTETGGLWSLADDGIRFWELGTETSTKHFSLEALGVTHSRVSEMLICKVLTQEEVPPEHMGSQLTLSPSKSGIERNVSSFAQTSSLAQYANEKLAATNLGGLIAKEALNQSVTGIEGYDELPDYIKLEVDSVCGSILDRANKLI